MAIECALYVYSDLFARGVKEGVGFFSFDFRRASDFPVSGRRVVYFGVTFRRSLAGDCN